MSNFNKMIILFLFIYRYARTKMRQRHGLEALRH